VGVTKKPFKANSSPFKQSSIYREHTTPKLLRKFVGPRPTLWYINGVFFQPKGSITPTS